MYQLDYTSNLPLFEQIIQKIKEHIVRGLLQPGDKIPSIREYASMVGINPNTVSKAYQELERQHVILTIKGKGAFVADKQNAVKSIVDTQLSKQTLEATLLDFIYQGIDAEILKQWVDEIYTELKGGT
ncbi:GntR family transcriptional regulator [Brochothrix campestris]|uniref:GntR family transcriptional regulator n=1 Tax=Brochothrix campestris FSL F6-1037 TaxID=1265861 RepID=W7CT63_9LIST|nr:GntR family transcriptional regulator [Brochothrix campestris]EUJ38991.1 GntR family transcriptional regulator [Brochothrix campestris FSL F6-1037]